MLKHTKRTRAARQLRKERPLFTYGLSVVSLACLIGAIAITWMDGYNTAAIILTGLFAMSGLIVEFAITKKANENG